METITTCNSLGEMELLEEDGYGYKLISKCAVGDSEPIKGQMILSDVTTETIQCNGSLLSSTARDFRVMYIRYMQAEAMNTTATEDMDQTFDDIEVMALQVPFKELMDMAIDDGIIDCYDDVYKMEEE